MDMTNSIYSLYILSLKILKKIIKIWEKQLTYGTLWPLPVWWTSADELTSNVCQLTDSAIQTGLILTPVLCKQR